MTKPNYTHATLVIDRSGSMQNKASEATNGIMLLQQEQFDLDGEFSLTIAQFDTEYERMVVMARQVEEYTLVPRGSTALLDSVAHEIIATGKDLADLPEDERPDKVLFVIVTDGEENSSTKWTLNQVKEMIENQKTNYGWEFLFLGADTSAWLGEALNVHTTSYQDSGVGTYAAYNTTSNILRSYRAGDSINAPDSV